MRRANRDSGFALGLVINILLNLEGLIPAAILLALHFWLDISIWWSVGAALLWLAYILLWMLVIRWAGKCSSTPERFQENKNPYSVGNNKKQQ